MPLLVSLSKKLISCLNIAFRYKPLIFAACLFPSDHPPRHLCIIKVCNGGGGGDGNKGGSDVGDGSICGCSCSDVIVDYVGGNDGSGEGGGGGGGRKLTYE